MQSSQCERPSGALVGSLEAASPRLQHNPTPSICCRHDSGSGVRCSGSPTASSWASRHRSSTTAMRCCLCLVALVGSFLAFSRAHGPATLHLRAHMRAGRALRTGLLPAGQVTQAHEAADSQPDRAAAAQGMIAAAVSQVVPRKLYPIAELNTARFSEDASSDDAYFAMCIAVKDQHADIREWILHHARIGAGKFYIFDNNSSTPMLDVMTDLVDDGLVEYNFVGQTPGNKKPQLHIYDTCLQDYGARHTWMSFTDADEFFVLRNDSLPELPVLLRQYEQYGALVVNWQMFASSGLIDRPERGALESYFKCFPPDHKENLHVKTIANTQHTLHAAGDPHHFIFKDDYFAVGENHERVNGPRSSSVHIDQVALYHYATKSLSEYQLKIRRGSAMGNQKTIHFFRFAEQEATHNCTDALVLG